MNPGNPQFVSVSRGLAGYFAVHFHTASLDSGTLFPEPWQTGDGRYLTYAEAEAEARDMAAALDVEFRPGQDDGALADTGLTLGQHLEGLGFEFIDIGGDS